jgi:Flp pilus assembly CpaE family ATPase
LSKPIVVAVISPNPEAQDVIVRALERTGSIDTVWSLLAYPEPSQIKDLPQERDGCVMFLDCSDRVPARAIAAEVHASHPAIKVVGMLANPKSATVSSPGLNLDPNPNPSPDPNQISIDLAALSRLGVRDIVGLPPAAHEVLQVLAKLPSMDELLPKEGTNGRIVAFLPAKPGVGATTLAVHTSAAVARLSGARTLLMDFDFRLGMTSFLLKLTGLYSVLDALDECGRLEIRWERLVNRRGMLDILGSAPQRFNDADPERAVAFLLGCARKAYRNVIVDLPGEMRDYEIDALRRAEECFLVCTPDIGVMHMAQRKAEQLRALQLGDKITVIMNRSGGMGFMSTRDVESILQLPVRFSVANAEKEIGEATKEARSLEGRGAVVAQIENIARRLLQAEAGRAEQPGARRFLEFFSNGDAKRRAGDR